MRAGRFIFECITGYCNILAVAVGSHWAPQWAWRGLPGWVSYGCSCIIMLCYAQGYYAMWHIAPIESNNMYSCCNANYCVYTHESVD